MALLTAARRWLIPAALVLLTLVPALHGSTITEAEVKAALIYNFASFVEWPTESATDQPLTVGVAGDDLVAAAVRSLPPLPNGRAIEVLRLDEAGDPRRCQVVYLALNERAIGAMLARLGSEPVLTVGEHDRFTQLGGMIRIFTEQGRLRFEVDQRHASMARLRISSRVLRLARLVRESDVETR